GAIIKIRSPITTKRALIDIGSAGPLSGFVMALIATTWGITHSTVVPRPEGEFMAFGSSLLFEMLTRVIHGPMPEGFDLLLNPVAFAGWIGLFITSINLLPVGQLDGGHIVYAFAGEAHR
ncbi:MAG: site-2 protease family protein, partial [Deltaproteobacteria bacterium]|nr:site-2 protease family protein [Deltaproteobacteria bacterium]